MANYKPEESDWTNVKSKEKNYRVLKKAALDKFDASILGLGNIKTPSSPINALAAVFDLEGFTNFCRQIDPHLAVPSYLEKFLPWLLEKIKLETIEKTFEEGCKLWHPLPFFTKFMGDGLLVLWNTDNSSPMTLDNTLVSLHMICGKYETELLSKLKGAIVEPPSKLRCGIARGTVFSVGDHADYVGTCINMAARIQKLPGVSFGFNRRGFDLERSDSNDYIKRHFTVKKVSIRGIGEGEFIAIPKTDLRKIPKEDKKLYKSP